VVVWRDRPSTPPSPSRRATARGLPRACALANEAGRHPGRASPCTPG